MKKVVLKVSTLLVALNVTLLGNTASEVVVETVEVSLDSFGTLSILLMVGLSSLLGAYFVKDEFSSMLD